MQLRSSISGLAAAPAAAALQGQQLAKQQQKQQQKQKQQHMCQLYTRWFQLACGLQGTSCSLL
jgi:hypothetical protein